MAKKPAAVRRVTIQTGIPKRTEASASPEDRELERFEALLLSGPMRQIVRAVIESGPVEVATGDYLITISAEPK